MNAVAWQNGNTGDYDFAIKLLGDNDLIYSIKSNKPNVIYDGCRTRKLKGETIFEVKTNKLNALPIIDFLPVDYGNNNQAFGFKAGPVCFL